MGSFLSIFSEPVDQTVNHDRAVLGLKTQRDELKKYMKRAAVVIDKEIETAQKLMKEGRRDKALLCLRKKRYQENLLKNAQVNLQNIEEMVNTIEFAQIQQQVFQSLKEGNKALKQLQTMSVEDVEELLLDTQEAVDHQKEIDELISQHLSAEDDADILKELSELMPVPEQPEDLELPEVPKHPLPTTEDLSMGEEEEQQKETTEDIQKTKQKTKKQAVLV